MKPLRGRLGRDAGTLYPGEHPAGGGPWLVQDVIDGPGFDYKVCGVDDRAAVLRVRVEPGCPDVPRVPVPDPDPSLVRLGLRTAEACGLVCWGIDVVTCANGPVIVDVNTFPGFRGVPDAAGLGRRRRPRRRGPGTRAMSVPRVLRTGGSAPAHALRAVVVEGFTTRLAFGVVIFAMPLYARQLGMSLAEIGVLVAMKPLVELIVKPFMGWTVDRWGARRGYLTAVTVRLVASMLLFTAATPASLYLVRLVQGAASAARDPASISVVARLRHAETRPGLLDLVRREGPGRRVGGGARRAPPGHERQRLPAAVGLRRGGLLRPGPRGVALGSAPGTATAGQGGGQGSGHGGGHGGGRGAGRRPAGEGPVEGGGPTPDPVCSATAACGCCARWACSPG
ncbi:MFS transporter [Actinomadura madurae]|uniref:MFS transporter n=1 Tax=Actinomadura madurae TaxID=1993 RepID=UPI0020D23FD5|nr:MFS transporter [Actinomadura madurae]MCP9969050.1 MFS transporter [Actinomadura madurae]